MAEKTPRNPAGVLTQAQAAEEMPADPMAADPAAIPEDDEVALAEGEQMASPEEQEQYKAIVTAGVKLISDKKANAAMIKLLERQGYNEGAIAQVVVDIVVQIDERLGGNIPDDMVLPAAQEIADVLLDYLMKIRKIDEQRFSMEKLAQALAESLAKAYGTQPDEVVNELPAAPGGAPQGQPQAQPAPPQGQPQGGVLQQAQAAAPGAM